LATQVEIIQSDRVVHAVIREVGLDKRPDVVAAWMKDTGGVGDILPWLARAMLKNLSVTPSSEGSTVTIVYESSEPKRATDIANAFARQYLEATLALRAGPAKQSAAYFEEQIAAYRQRLNAAQAKMSAFQQATGIVTADGRVDIENQRLQELSSQLVQIQTLSAESRSRRDAVGRQGRESMPEVVQNTLVQSLKSELGRAEAKLQEMSSRLGSNHPQYMSAQAEVSALRSRLNAEVDKVSRSIMTSATVNAQRESETRAALEAQRAKVLRLKKDYDQLNALNREVDEAQKALDLVAQRLTQTNITSMAPQSNVSILAPALEPSEPSRPKPLLNMIVGGFVGLLLGLLAALSIESFKRPIRTAEDLLQAVAVPVLAVLPPSDTRRAQRLIGSTGPTITPPNLRLGN
jgi:chain length determinant protein EpsF